MRYLALALSLAACGGGTPAPAPAPAPAAPAPAPAPPPPAPAPAPPPDLSTMTPDQQKAELMKAGEVIYKTGGKGIACMTCHGENGQGTPPAFPPLVGQKDWMGDCGRHAGLVVHGLQGEIDVGGTKYNGVMTPQGAMLSDFDIAAVITYERNSWGNDFGICMPADVAAARTAPPPAAPN